MKSLLFLLLLTTFTAKAQSDFMVFDLENGKKDTLYTTVDTPPIVKGDEPAFYEAFLAELNFNPYLREHKLEITIPLMFRVTKQGNVKDIDLVEPTTEPTYDEQVLKKAKAFFTNRPTFSSPKTKNKMVNAVYLLDVIFKPNRKKESLKKENHITINSSIDTILVKNLQNNRIYKRIITTSDTTGIVYDVDGLQERAEFPGGVQELIKYLSSSVKYPPKARENGIQGRVVVKYIVNEEGYLSEIIILKSVHPLLDAEAIRVAQEMPKWTPGKIGGVPVKSYFTMPVSFKLEG